MEYKTIKITNTIGITVEFSRKEMEEKVQNEKLD